MLRFSAKLGKITFLMPTTPQDRVAILGDTIMKTLQDRIVVEEAKRPEKDLEILTGAEIEAQLRDVMGQPKVVIERVMKL